MRIPKHLLDNPKKLEQDLTDESWDNFTADNKEMVPTEKLRSHIEAHIGSLPAPVPVKNIRRMTWIAAASITLLAGLGLLFLKQNAPEKQKPIVVSKAPTADPASPVPRVIANSSQRKKTFILPDGSKVDLAAASSLSFNAPFAGQRDIYLDGAAIFNVKKDNAHPFIVHSKGITTTVLGTVFSVSDKQSRFTTVHLFSGKVVVKRENGRSFKDIYLSPVQQLIINNGDFTAQIKQAAPAVTTKKDSTLSAPLQVMDFDNRPLEEIFTLLQKSYNTTISFDPASLRNMSFTGKFNKSRESLESFLSTLCDLNDLSLKITGDNSFIIQGK